MRAYPQVLTEAETVAAAVAGRSLARFGDGELKLCLGRNAKTQHYDKRLAAYLRECLADEDPACLPCIPPGLGVSSPKDAFWEPYRTDARYLDLYERRAAYGSSWITRPDSAPWLVDVMVDRVPWIWRDRDIVLVGSSGKALQADELEGAKSVEHVDAPLQHAWADHQRLWTRLRNESRTVILCLGATATALAYRLAHRGVHAVDLGHLGMFRRKIARGEDPTRRTQQDERST